MSALPVSPEGARLRRQREGRGDSPPSVMNLPEENVVDLLSDEGSQSEELPINPMQDGLEEVTLSGVFTVKKLQEL